MKLFFGVGSRAIAQTMAHVPHRAPEQEGWLGHTPSLAAVLPAGLSSTARWVPGTAQPRAAPQGWQGLSGDVMGLGAQTFGSKFNSSLSFAMSPTNLGHVELLFAGQQFRLLLHNLALTMSLPGWHQPRHWIQPKHPLPSPFASALRLPNGVLVKSTTAK